MHNTHSHTNCKHLEFIYLFECSVCFYCNAIPKSIRHNFACIRWFCISGARTHTHTRTLVVLKREKEDSPNHSLQSTDVTISISQCARTSDCLIIRKSVWSGYEQPYTCKHLQITRLLDNFGEKIMDKYNDHFLRMTSRNSANIHI